MDESESLEAMESEPGYADKAPSSFSEEAGEVVEELMGDMAQSEKGETVEQVPLARGVILTWILGGLIRAVMLGTFGLVGNLLDWWTLPWSILGGGVGFLLLQALIWPFFRYRSFDVSIRPESVLLCQGVLWRSCVAVPHVRIQHVDTRQSPVEQLLGLSSLMVFTAGTGGADLLVPGLRPEQAEALRDQLVLLGEFAS